MMVRVAVKTPEKQDRYEEPPGTLATESSPSPLKPPPDVHPNQFLGIPTRFY
jgi:hypothetical protein